MAQGQFIAYYRVSTARQGMSGLGLDAQREAVARYLNGGEWELMGEFTETETGKGANPLEKRPQLRAALELCKRRGATLIIAKLDRLARNVAFIAGMLESKVKFVACDMPDANELTVHIMAAFAEHEAKRIGERTRDALAAAKARGVRLGVAGPANLKPNLEARKESADAFAGKLAGLIVGFRARSLTQRAMVSELNALGIKAPNGGEWHRGQLCRLLSRIDRLN
ncbi:recombinase family protein [Paraburkholderia silviterrae]|uniref:Recombinase family protein n=1 Tax=Paraburkholderia silviterrae TaxID=2528715 RepID=A0A4R5MDG5_9BURK|nr:recombinase family protein [Paraburkholderia silviterrae]TDG24663.1 recombinase family protein [Paraburkholderia silviterrae]